MSAPDPDLGHSHTVALAVAQEAGALLAHGFSGDIEFAAKGEQGDVVTNLDLAAEELIVTRLTAAFPEHRIIAEESGLHGRDGGWTWLVDPLDGTNNVAVGLPAFVVGLALCHEHRPMVGVVHEPLTGRTWSAVRGQGANGPNGPLRVRLRDTPNGPLMGWTQGHGVARNDPAAQALKFVLEQRSYRTLQLWAPLICWVMLAGGQIDGFIGYRAEAVDLPAGSIIATEAGMAVVALDGSDFVDSVLETDRRSFVAGHPDRLGELLELVGEAGRLQPSMAALGVPAR